MNPRLAFVALTLLSACEDGGQNSAASEPAAAAPSAALAYEEMWATSQRVQRRTCPSERCGIVGQLFFRESAHVYEREDGWARVTETYSASCVAGKSEYVDRGPDACSADNGIVEGQFAEWVRLDHLSTDRPPDPADTATVDEALISGSDDFSQHRAAFTKAANDLIGDNRCTAADFQEIGGWWKSSNHRDAPVYFTYCGGMTISNRLYLDASTGRIFQE